MFLTAEYQKEFVQEKIYVSLLLLLLQSKSYKGGQPLENRHLFRRSLIPSQLWGQTEKGQAKRKKKENSSLALFPSFHFYDFS